MKPSPFWMNDALSEKLGTLSDKLQAAEDRGFEYAKQATFNLSRAEAAEAEVAEWREHNPTPAGLLAERKRADDAEAELATTCNAEELRQVREDNKRFQAEVARLNNLYGGSVLERETMQIMWDEDKESYENQIHGMQIHIDEIDRLQAEVARLTNAYAKQIDDYESDLTELHDTLRVVASERDKAQAEVARLTNENSLMAAHQGIDNHQRLLDRIAELETEVARLKECNEFEQKVYRYQDALIIIAACNAALERLTATELLESERDYGAGDCVPSN